jgi:hypothetical protein
VSIFRAFVLVTFALLPGGSLFAGSVAIGQLQLGENNGYQTISFFNNTGGSAGCGVGGSEYLSCTGVDITSWSLTLTFVNENPSDPGASYVNTLTSPIMFSSGLGDVIGPFDGNNPYIGGLSGTWEIPLSFGNTDEPDCGPTCDYQLTEVDFSGTIDTSDLPMRLYNGQIYDGSDPSTYTIFNAAGTFSAGWTISPDDYATLADPAFLSDQTDVLISDQAPASSTPEPSTRFLILAGCLAAFPVRWVHRNRRAAQVIAGSRQPVRD